MFWECLNEEEQNRYWVISQRLKKYVAARLLFPDISKRVKVFLSSTPEEREELCRKEERRINHWIQSPENQVKITVERREADLMKTLLDCEQDLCDNFCTDEELVEADRLCQKGWGG